MLPAALYFCRMNYFELFDMPVAFLIPQKELAQKFFALQKKFHPDYFAYASSQEKEEMLEMSSQVNKAYNTFKNQDATIKYVLQLKNGMAEDEKYTLPADFLMEVMELNEQKMDGTLDAGALRQQASELLEASYKAIAPILQQYKEGAANPADLQLVKDYYFKKKYIDRLMGTTNDR